VPRVLEVVDRKAEVREGGVSETLGSCCLELGQFFAGRCQCAGCIHRQSQVVQQFCA
jgi:hypothetical protein